MNWKALVIDLGRVEQRARIKFKYTSIGILDIVKLTPGCGGCTTISGYKEGTLSVVYKVDTIPKHLSGKDYKVRKSIILTYKDGTQEVLTFTATIKP